MGVRRPAYSSSMWKPQTTGIPRVNWLASKLWVQARENSSKTPDVNCAPISKCTCDPEYTCTVCRHAKQCESEGVHLAPLLTRGTGQQSATFPSLGCLSPGVGPLHPVSTRDVLSGERAPPGQPGNPISVLALPLTGSWALCQPSSAGHSFL